MAKRISKISYGTIGNNPCEISLNKILISYDDPKITRKITKCLYRLKDLQRKTLNMCKSDVHFATHILIKWKIEADNFINRLDEIDLTIRSHTRTCIATYHRQSLEKLNGILPKRD